MKKKLQEITKFFCISLVTKQEYAAAQATNRNIFLVKIGIILLLLLVVGFIFYKFKELRKGMLLGSVAILVLSGSVIGYFRYQNTLNQSKATLTTETAQDLPLKLNTDNSFDENNYVTISCGDKLLKDWWQW